MALSDLLKDMVEGVKGGYAGVIMATDGIAVDKYIKEGADWDIDVFGVEYGNIIDELGKSSEVLAIGELEETIVISHGVKVIMRLISKDLFVAFILSPDGIVGKARFRLGRAAKLASKELFS